MPTQKTVRAMIPKGLKPGTTTRGLVKRATPAVQPRRQPSPMRRMYAGK